MEIFRLVKDQVTEEKPNDGDSNEPPPRPKPTAKEVFKAISLINDYIESKNSEVADNLNQSMELYSQQILDHLNATASQKNNHRFLQQINLTLLFFLLSFH